MKNIQDLIKILASGYCDVLKREEVSVYTPSHIHLIAAYGCISEKHHADLDKAIAAEIADRRI